MYAKPGRWWVEAVSAVHLEAAIVENDMKKEGGEFLASKIQEASGVSEPLFWIEEPSFIYI